MSTTTKARPLLFSAPMVRALLAGTKRQTRRYVNPLRPASCPYGDAGDLLWVRETWREHEAPDQDGETIAYRADRPEYLKSDDDPSSMPWCPSIFMPRKFSRITLGITEVGVQRLQQISEADAIAEGIEREGEGWKSYEVIHEGRHKGERHPHAVVPNCSPIISYKELWESINGPHSWTANPWVWVLSFDVIQKNITEVFKDG